MGFIKVWVTTCSLILLASLCDGSPLPAEDDPEPPSGYSESNKENIKKGEDSMRHITFLVGRMKRDDSTSDMIPGTMASLTTKLGVVGTKWKTQVRDAYNADSEGTAERISGAIAGVGTGLVEVVGGIKNKDWKAGIKGALTIASSIAQLAGPVGMIAASVLSFFSSMLDLFGGSAKTESMDDKIERIVKEQIDIGREKDLKAEVEGVKLEFTSISTSLQHYRESKKLERNEAIELYNVAFNGLVVFGKLRARINEICDIDLSKSDSDKQKAAKKCLGIVNLLCEVSILRQLLLSDMAAVLSDVHDSQNETSQSRGGLLVVANNVLSIVKKEQENDGNFLSFLTDPFDNPNRRYVTAIFFGAPSQYATLLTYIETLDKIVSHGMFNNYLMLCKGAFFTGVCNVFEKRNYPNLADDPKFWLNSAKSLFVPPNLQATGFSHVDFRHPDGKWGPYVGPSAYEFSSREGRDDWDSIKIEESTRNALHEVRICEKKSMAPGRCHTLPIGEFNLENIDGLKFEGKTASIHIPQGLGITGYTQKDKKGNSYNLFIGEDTLNDVYDYPNWKSIKVFDAKRYSDASEHVKFCSEENLKGKCKTTWTSTNGFMATFGMNFNRIRSMKIPGGLKVTGYSERDRRGGTFGPYIGPALIPKIDPLDSWKSMSVSEFGQEKIGI